MHADATAPPPNAVDFPTVAETLAAAEAARADGRLLLLVVVAANPADADDFSVTANLPDGGLDAVDAVHAAGIAAWAVTDAAIDIGRNVGMSAEEIAALFSGHAVRDGRSVVRQAEGGAA